MIEKEVAHRPTIAERARLGPAPKVTTAKQPLPSVVRV